MAQYYIAETVAEDHAKLAARLLSVPASGYDQLVLIRPGYEDIRRQIWIDRMRANATLAAELEWSEKEPLG